MGLLIFASVTNIVKVREGKETVATREPDLKKELKRGSMKEKWGLTLIHRTGEGNRIELGVSKVGKFFLGHFHNNLLRWQCSAQPPRPASCLATL